MKIKCPICEKLGYEVTERKLHVVGYHILLFKIHEKIEDLEKPKVTDCLIHNCSEHDDIDKIIARNLKSLLENKK